MLRARSQVNDGTMKLLLRSVLPARGVDIREETWPGGPGTVLAVTLDTQPVPTLFFGLGARGKRAERVADEAVDQVVAYVDAAAKADRRDRSGMLNKIIGEYFDNHPPAKNGSKTSAKPAVKVVAKKKTVTK